MNRIINILSITFLCTGLWSCGDSSGEGFEETFGVNDSVSNSVFAQTDSEVVEGNYFLQVISTDVSSGFVDLNGERLLAPNDFKNDSFDQTMAVDLFEENTIEVEIRGQPGDQLCVRVYEEIDGEEDRGIFERCVDREAGPPNNVSVVITPTPTPTPLP